MPLIAQKLKGVADVVFVMDISGSMSPVISSVKNHITSFVDSVRKYSQPAVDLRLGLVAHYADGGDRRGVYAWEFTDSSEVFKTQLGRCDSLPASGDEFGLPALDRALDFPWRPKCRRFVISFTDEPVSGGTDHPLQTSRLKELAEKFVALRVAGYLVAPACPDYDELGRAPRMVRVVLGHGELASYDFGNFLKELGRTVSTASEQGALPVRSNLYGL